MKIIITLVYTFFFTVSLLACSYSSDSSTKNVIDEMRICTVDNDCISVASSCCGCTAGGSNMAISADKKSQWTKSHREECKTAICPSVMSKHKSCSAKPMCINKQCVLQAVK